MCVLATYYVLTSFIHSCTLPFHTLVAVGLFLVVLFWFVSRRLPLPKKLFVLLFRAFNSPNALLLPYYTFHTPHLLLRGQH